MADSNIRSGALSEEKIDLFELLLQKKGISITSTQRIRPREGNGPCRLSFAQERLWFIAQLDPGSVAYNLPIALRLSGPLDVVALERSLNEIIKRHESLRTNFDSIDGQAIQITSAPPPIGFPIIDLSHWPAAEREAEVRRLASEEAALAFDLAREPLLRMKLLWLNDQEHVLLFTMHHIVSDDWSMGLLTHEIAALYEAFTGGQTSPLAELPIQYADYAVWQRERLQGKVLEQQLAYWKTRLAGAPTLLDLPTDHSRPPVQTYRGAQLPVSLRHGLTEQLKQLGRQEGATLFMVLLAGFQTLLWRYTGQSDVVVGTPIANRTRPETKDLIGFFLNTLALRASVDEGASWRDLLRQVREVCLGAYAHQEVPFEKLIEELQPVREMSHHPLFQVMIALQNTPRERVEIRGLKVSEVKMEADTARFDLTLLLGETTHGLYGEIKYNTDLFDEPTIARMAQHYQRLLSLMSTEPDQLISRAQMLSERERRQMLYQWNQTTRIYPQDLCLHQLFEQQVERSPNATALVFGEQELTYEELNWRANQLAHYLQKQSVGPESLVGICLERSVEMVIALFGVLKTGAAYLPLDPSYPPSRLSFMLDDAQVSLLLTQQHLLASVPIKAAQPVCVDGDWELIAGEDKENPAGKVTTRTAAYVIYTSGSTGQPKGVMVSQRNLLNLLLAMQEQPGFGVSDTLLAVTTLSFDIAALEIYLPLIVGARLEVAGRDLVADATLLRRALRERGITVMQATPSMWRMLIEEGWDGEAQLRVWSGGEAMGRDLAEGLVRRAAEVWNLYGPTESTIWSTVARVEAGSGRVGIGRAIANTQVYVVDGEMELVAAGIRGELLIGGAGLAYGYVNRAGETAARFVPDGFSGQRGGRLYRTGDLVRYRANGELEYVGRRDEQVKVRGYRIELGEVEAVLREHSGVREAVVVVREEVAGDKRLVAYVVAEEAAAVAAGEGGGGAEVSELGVAALREYLKERLPEYMVPGAFVMLAELPLTANGKVDRRALPAPGHTRSESAEYVGPRTVTEQTLAGIWSEVLRLPQISIHDNFFELGGHSLLATQIISRVRQTFEIEIPLRALFEEPTIAGLGRRIAAERGAGMGLAAAPPLRRVSREQELPLSYAQQRLWFLDQLAPGSTVYNIPIALHLSGALEVAALEQSVSEVVRRHEVLRTSFESREGRPVQVIAAAEALSFPVTDLSALAAAEQERAVREMAAAAASQLFDLGRGPLLRVQVLRLSEAEHVLLVTMHHIVSDGWSMGVLTGEVAALYEAYTAGASSPLAELEIQYADYAVWQREWLQGEVLERELEYWREQLADAPTVLELPMDRPRPAVQSYGGRTEAVVMNASLTAGLQELSQREGVTMFMSLLAAFEVLLWRYTGQSEMVVGTSIANRTRKETEGLIGFFVNLLPLRGSLGEEISWRELLQRAREVCLGAYGHQEVPFEKLVEELQPAREMSHHPLFQVLMELQNAPQEAVGLKGLKLRGLDVGGVTAKFELRLSLMQNGGEVGGILESNAELFEAETIRRMVRHYQRLVESLVAEPERRLGAVQMLSEEEREQLVSGWNQTVMECGREQGLAEMFEAQVRRSPEAVALVYGEQKLTYEELNGRANQLAHHLGEYGVGVETVVGVLIERSVELVVGLLGVLKAGAAYLPLESGLPLGRIAYMLEETQAPVVLTQESLLDRVPAHWGHTLCVDSEWGEVSQESGANLELATSPERLAYVIYTSGSTGRPKGVMIPQRGVVNYLSWCRSSYEVSAGAGSPLHTSISFDLTVTSLFGPLVSGGAVELLGAEPGPEVLSSGIKGTEDYSLVKLTPGHLELLNRGPAGERIAGWSRVLVIGGEALSGESLRYWQEHAPETRLINEYGPTETVVGCSMYEVQKGEEVQGSVPIGRPIGNVQMYVVDESGEVVTAGVKGEIVIGGAGVGRGYLGRAWETAERFRPDGFSGQSGARVYHSGDVGRHRGDGELEYVGRRDEQVKVRGYRIELGEVEAVLREHSGVREAVVVMREEVAGDKRLVAYVVATEERAGAGEGAKATELEAGTLREYLRERLPEYMVPGAFVVLAEMPLTANGKVNRRALPTPEQTRSESEEYVAPRTAAEQTLARIWSEVLRLPQIGIYDNFFELGGDSILSIQVISRANRAGLQLTPRQLFEHQSIATLAAVAGTESQVQAEQGVVSGAVELTPVQHWFFEQEMSEPEHFNQALLLGVREALDPGVLEQAVKQLLRHHDALRLRFERTAEGWQQVNAEVEEHQVFAVREVRGETAAELVAALHEGASEVQRSLDLGAGPLMRVAYFKVGGGADNTPGVEGGGRLLLAIHHLAVDGVSWRILLEDLRSAYEQLSRGEVVKLPPKTSSYQQWAQRLVAYAGSAGLQAELGYWTAGRGEQVRQLPVDVAGGENTRQSSGMVVVELDEEQTRALVQEVPAVYHTQINDLLLTALGLAYREWSGAEQLLIDLEGHGREDLFAEVDVSRTVGWFTAIFPVLLEVRGPENGANPQAAALKEIKEQLRAVPGRGIGYGLLRYLTPSAEVREQLRQMGRAEVSFNYLGQVDQVLGEEGLFAAAGESSGPSQSEQGERHYLLEINAIIAGGQLRVSWSYSRNLHLAESIERLASAYIKELEGLIGHCQSAGAGGYTPSDFGLARVSQEWLDKGQQQGWEIADIYGLSPLQQGLLFHTIYAPELGEYVVQLSYQVKGELQVGALRRAWQEVMERHAVLRSSFHWEEQGEPVQVVHRGVELEMREEDWRGLEEREQEERLEEELGADRRRGFELQQAPLMRVQLARVGEQSYWVVWSFHHLLLDGWSVPRVLKEVFNYYEAYSQGRELELAESQPYVNYIRWLGRQDLAAAEEYWRERLKGFSEPTPLPFSQSNGNRAGEAGYRNERFELSERVTQELRAYSRQQQVTINTVVQGAWALLLWRYSGEGDVVYGATVSGRPAELAGVEEMVGLFINTLPVRVEVRPEQEVGEWLRQLQTEQVEMRQYEYSPLVAVQGWSEVERGQGLFESIVVFENYPLETVFAEPAGAQVTAAAADAAAEAVAISGVRSVEWTNYPLTIIAMPGQRLSLTIDYDDSRFEAEQARRIAEHYERLLAGLITDAGQQLGAVQMLSEVERQQVIHEWNQTEREYAEELSLAELFEAQVERTPAAVALVFGEQELTYRELNRRANQLGHYLRQLGVRAEVAVGVCLERSVEMVVGLLGVLKAGGVYVPLDGSYPRERLTLMMADAEVVVVLTQESMQSRLGVEGIKVVCVAREWSEIAEQSEEALGPQSGEEHLAYITYTSGSTGRPKGVMVPQRAVRRLVQRPNYVELSGEERILQLAPLAFDASTFEIWGSLLNGGRLVMMGPEQPTLAEIGEVLERQGVTTLWLTAGLFHLMVEEQLERLGSVRQLLAGGEVLSVRDVERMRQRWPECVVINGYGPTENTTFTTCHRVGAGAELGRSVPIGRGVTNTQVYVVDREQEVVAVGVVGELYTGGAGLARGYLSGAGETAARFVPDGFSGQRGGRLYRTGDLVRYVADGVLEYVGRRDEQVKVRGYRIELGEVEAVLREHSGVREVVVVMREEVAGDKRLVAYVVAEAAAATELEVGALREYLKERLPEYMVPGAFVVLAEMPLTANGKVDRRALPAPGHTRSESAEYVGPRTVTEQTLAGIWSEVLRLPQIGIYDNFFELGGHSLLATQVVSRMRQAFEIELPLRTLFEEPTIAALAKNINAAVKVGETLHAPPLKQLSRETELPLSFAQQRLWFLDYLLPGSTVYNIPLALHLSGALKIDALEQSLSELVRRHEVLRTSFASREGRAFQIISPPQDIHLVVADLSSLPHHERELEVRALADAAANEPFDLAAGSLLRVKLLRLSEDDHVLLMTTHHIISDGWSMEVLTREIATLYDAYSRGEKSPLPELEIQYADFAAWQREWLQGAILEQELAYWKQQLMGAPQVLELPTDHPRPAVQSNRGARLPVSINSDLAGQLKRLSQQEGVTLFMLLLAVYEVLLYRYTEQTEVVVGVPIANRTHAETESLIGFFVNTLPLRINLAGEPSWRELLQRVRESTLGAFAHPDLPFERLVEELQPERDMSHHPLLQVSLSVRHAPPNQVRLEGLKVRIMTSVVNTAAIDLSLLLTEGSAGLSGGIEYSTDLFEEATIRRMSLHFERLAEAIMIDPNQPITLAQILTDAERAQLVYEWNQNFRNYPLERPVHALFEEQVERTPRAVALVYEEEQLNYQELNRRANQLANHLQVRGVGPEVMVAVCFERSFDMIISVLAILKVGGAYVPLDPSYPEERLSFMMEDTGVAVLLTQTSLAENLPATSAQAISLDADWADIAKHSAENLDADVSVDNLAYVIYTSGSSGTPKGVMLAHRGLSNLALDQVRGFEVKPEDRLLQFASFSFDASVAEIFTILLSGGSLCLAHRDDLLPGPDLARMLRRQEVTLMFMPPSVLAALPAEDLPALRTIVAAGEACSAEIVARWAPNHRFINGYGPTEVTIGASFGVVDGERKPLIGRPFANVEIYIVDSHLQPVPVGVPGHMHVASPGLARGYLRQPALTAEKFIPDPFSGRAGMRLYRTGDRARYRSDGNIEFLGRIDDQVKVRGYRIELGEIESLLSQHEVVSQAVVVARQDGNASQRLVAYVVPRHPAQPTVLDQPSVTGQSLKDEARRVLEEGQSKGEVERGRELRQYLRDRLPEYMVPMAFVMLAEMPLTTNGKVDRRGLPEPEHTRAEDDSYEAPRSAVEELLADIWSELLGVERIGTKDNFFELGGHSLIATQVISRIRIVFNVEIPLRALFEEPTIAGLGRRIAAERGAGMGLAAAPPLRRVSREQELPLSYAQQRLWFLDQLAPGSTVYNIPIALHLSGALEVAALEQSVSEVVRRHEVLRTSFESREGRPVQVIAGAEALSFPVTDLSALAAAEQERAVREMAAAAASQLFDLGRGPLLRVQVLRLSEAEHVLLVTMHHIVSDGWSMGVLTGEVAALYEAYTAGASSPLAELEIQYADYAVWQREWLQGEVLERELEYWREQLADAPTVMELPMDRPRPAVQSYGGRTEAVVMNASLTAGLQELSQREGVTMFMSLLAAFEVLLWRYTGQSEMVVGTSIANRTRKETEGLIGFFVNLLPLRGSLGEEISWRELLQRAREVCLGAYGHQEVPFEKLVEELQPAREMSHHPLFQVLMELQNAPQEAVGLKGLKLRGLDVGGVTAKFELRLSLMQNGGEVGGILESNAELFEAETIRRMVRHYQRLVESLVAEPERRLGAVQMLSEEEREQLVSGWNQTVMECGREQGLAEMFEAQVRRSPEAVALVYGEQKLTYEELNGRANQLAHHLGEYGVGVETVVGVLIERSVELVVGLLGVLKAGAAYLPLESGLPLGRLAYMLEETQAPVVLTQESLLDRVPAHWGHTLCVDSEWGEVSQESGANLELATSPERLAYVIYTSGSTGKPKGVMIPQRGVVNYLSWCRSSYEVSAGAGSPLHTSISFDLTVTSLFGPLVSGVAVELLGAEPGPEVLSSGIKGTEDYSLVKLTPGHLELLNRGSAGERIAGWSRVLVIGGEALSGESLRYWQEHAPETRLINEYGPTETVVGCSMYEVQKGEEVQGSVPIGRPIGNVQMYVVDESGEVVAAGVKGEIVIGGAGVGRGYLGRAWETAERFRPDGFSGQSGARVYHSGDVGRHRGDGELEYVGRRDEQVKVRGYRIELGEVEAVLREHSGVREAVVVMREEVAGDKRLVAYVVADEAAAAAGGGAEATEIGVAALREYLKERLPDYMTPSAIVMLDEMPLTTNGKVNRRQLLKYEASGPMSEALWTAPQTKSEQAIAAIWREVLKLERVGIHDNFFQLGGHSLLLIQVHIKLQKEFDDEIKLIELFEYPTIGSLAGHLNKMQEDTSSFQAGYDRAELRRARRKARRQAGQNVIETVSDRESYE